MQRLQTALISLSTALSFCALGFAADPGTYRPGQPYSAVAAATHSLCEAQCQGDAACRGWNFVRANPRQKTGICEFNSRAVSPIQSPISVSANQSQIVNTAGQSRIIPAGIRTTRIGSPQATKPAQNVNSPRKTTQTLPAQQPQTRRVIRQQIPAQISPQASAYRPNAARPSTAPAAAYRHSLGGAPQVLNRQINPRQINPHQVLPARSAPNIARPGAGLPPRAPAAFNAPQSRAPRGQVGPRLQQQQYPAPQQNSAAARQGQAQLGPQAQINRPQRGGLIRALTGQDALTPQSTAPHNTPPTTALSYEDASQQSLYGHLNDDVAAPKVLKAEDFNIPNDQPIPTVHSVPVKPVNRETFTGLAGG